MPVPVAAADKTSEFLRRASCLEGVEQGEEPAAAEEEEPAVAKLGRSRSSVGWVAAAVAAEDIPPPSGAEPVAAADEDQDPTGFRTLAPYDEELGSLQREKGEAPNKETWR